MTPTSDNIELKSEKVRNIIGQIPPRIIRMGISVLFFIITGLVLFTTIYQYDLMFKSTALISQLRDTTVVQVVLPANQITLLNSGNKVVLNFDRIPNLNNIRVITTIQTIPNELYVNPKGGYYIATIILPVALKSSSGIALRIESMIEIDAEISLGKMSFYDRMMGSLRQIHLKK